jgi:hypothetical protein
MADSQPLIAFLIFSTIFILPNSSLILFFAPSAQNGRISGTVRKRMGVVALAVPSQLGAAIPSAGDSRRYNGGSVKMHRLKIPVIFSI